ncbi:MAG TPA: TPM domain-containing protein [Polyangiaceae bacterium]|nr:TPM domain-containing protein [Polyangiaceae bacterium]
MALLNDEEKLRVRDAVASAERNTSGELVVAVTPRATDYAAVRALWALPLALALAAELQHRCAPESVWLGYLLVFPLALGLFALLGQGALLRLVTPSRLVERGVEDCAARAFIELGLRETRDRSGVLLLVCEAEHRVRVLADRGIDERVESGAWQHVVDELIAALRAGRPAEGLVRATEQLGAILAQHCPPRADDTNELPNEVREI